MPNQDPTAKAFFDSVVPTDHPGVTVRPMFGNTSAFVNGNMFMGVFGTDLLLRLPDDERWEIESKGGRPFEPMPGRPMTGFVLIPPAWHKQPKRVREWVVRSLEFAEAMPPKQPKPRAKKKS
jgi:TfoX/Sxy family transcriptional regulator of competence genes